MQIMYCDKRGEVMWSDACASWDEICALVEEWRNDARLGMVSEWMGYVLVSFR